MRGCFLVEDATTRSTDTSRKDAKTQSGKGCCGADEWDAGNHKGHRDTEGTEKDSKYALIHLCELCAFVAFVICPHLRSSAFIRVHLRLLLHPHLRHLRNLRQNIQPTPLKCNHAQSPAPLR